MKQKGQHIDLLDRFISGESSPEEEASLLEWFKSVDSKEELSTFYEDKWLESAGKRVPTEIQNRMLSNIRGRIHSTKELKGSSNVSLYFTKILSYAAVAIVCFLIGAGAYRYSNTNTKEVAPNDYVVLADNGQRASVVLPDGTKVWLNSHTKLTYNSDYGIKDRYITLSGEAYFEVAKDSLHRFLVNAGGMEVEALGTAFNVKAYEEEEELVTTLFEGSVRASVGSKYAILKPDQSAVFNKSNHRFIVDKDSNPLYAKLWRVNELAFSGETLEEISIMLNRMYNIEIRFLSNKIKKYSFSGVIKNISLDNVIEIISLTAPITYSAIGDTIYLDER